MKSAIPWLYGHLPLSRRMRTGLTWLLSPKFTVGVMGLVRDPEGRVLLLKHTYRRSRPWGLPGGGLHPGELLEECLCRELREETGLEVVVDGLLSAAAHPSRLLVDMVFACHPAPGQSLDTFTPNAEVAEARFFALDALPESVEPGMRRLIEVAVRQAGRPFGDSKP